MKARRFSAGSLAVLALTLALNAAAFASGVRIKVIYSPANSTSPGGAAGSFVVDKNGNLYAIGSGGPNTCYDMYDDPYPCGTIYELAAPTSIGAGWSASQRYDFQGSPVDGSIGASPLMFDRSGNLLGSTTTGGIVACGAWTHPEGCGTIFQLTPPTQSGASWTETVLYMFQGTADGDFPSGRMVEDEAGNLYGITLTDGVIGSGVVFQLAPPSQSGGAWTETVIYRFGQNSGDGLSPSSGLLRDHQGNLYGVTQAGGNPACNTEGVGCGVVYRLSPPKRNGEPWTETNIYLFTGGSDGSSPRGELALDAAGNLYGATTTGFLNDPGTVFQLSPTSSGSWNLTTLHTFTSHGDGSIPAGGVILDKQGNVYGVTELGGDATKATGCWYEQFGCGTIYEISPGSSGWTEQILHRFHLNDNVGISPNVGLVFGRGGALYGSVGGNAFQLIVSGK